MNDQKIALVLLNYPRSAGIREINERKVLKANNLAK